MRSAGSVDTHHDRARGTLARGNAAPKQIPWRNASVAILPPRELAVIIVSRGAHGAIAHVSTPAPGRTNPSVVTPYACFDPIQATATAIQVACGGLLEPDRLQHVRARRLACLLQTCVTRSPLYRKWLRGFDPASARLQDLPVAHRERLMRQFDDWVTDSSIRIDELRSFVSRPERIADTYRGRYIVWQSSGTSGEPGIFVQDATAMAAYDALEAVRGPFMRWAMSPLVAAGLQRNLVLIGSTEEHYASTVSAKRLRQLNPWFSQRLHDVSFLQPMPRLRQALEALDPIVMATFPSVALQLAQEHRDGHLDATPQEIWVGGETLSPATREFIECTFGCRVRNSYGSSEFLSIAFECSQGVLHLNADWVILEPLDRHGRPVPLDVEGESVLLTHLANHVQPLLRYVLPDRVTLHSRPCTCGSALPVLTVHGRDDDVLRLPGRGRSTVTVSPLAITTVIEERAGLLDFQVQQVSQTGIALISRRNQAGEDARRHHAARALEVFLAELGAVGVRVTDEWRPMLSAGPGGKVRRVMALH